MFEEQRKSYEVQLRKLKEELRAELKEEGLRAELQKVEVVTEEHLLYRLNISLSKGFIYIYLFIV